MEWFIQYGGAEEVPAYDCKASNRKHGATNIALGVVFINYGVIVEALYLLAMIVMLKEKNRRLSCYKIMITLGVYDMASVWINSLLTGYFWFVGANYCTNSTLIYVVGAIGIGEHQ
ncbi:hypothetical protein ANCCAN_13181 [Ancylostoma caninum]|uniref:G-protein coupled receptors family 1 profile domain-containing protein n=1 Tax=Ancylostoma caninum TaxID=29170 RepID=A0A368G8Y6_ANCCA|nr:hypothetical protein ANCCAN_13181 [Ancylostoma caninum]